MLQGERKLLTGRGKIRVIDWGNYISVTKRRLIMVIPGQQLMRVARHSFIIFFDFFAAWRRRSRGSCTSRSNTEARARSLVTTTPL